MAVAPSWTMDDLGVDGVAVASAGGLGVLTGRALGCAHSAGISFGFTGGYHVHTALGTVGGGGHIGWFCLACLSKNNCFGEGCG